MLSKNNFHEKIRQMEEKRERFSIRKLSIGAASVLIGFAFMGFGAHSVQADEIVPDSKPATAEVTAASGRITRPSKKKSFKLLLQMPQLKMNKQIKPPRMTNKLQLNQSKILLRLRLMKFKKQLSKSKLQGLIKLLKLINLKIKLQVTSLLH